MADVLSDGVDWSGLLSSMSLEQREELLGRVKGLFGDDLKFMPFAGTQEDAYFSPAEKLLFGGRPSGGKSILLSGLALQEQHRSLLVRKQHSDLRPLLSAGYEIAGMKNFSGGDGSSGSRPVYNDGKRLVHYMGVDSERALTSLQGERHEFIGVDEAAQIAEEKIRFMLGWWRKGGDTPDDVRKRMVFATNPPTDSIGYWLVNWFEPWLDDTYHSPAAAGEVRWMLPQGERFKEAKEGDSIMLGSTEVFAESFSFIPSRYQDNPYTDDVEFAKSLAAMPDSVREIMLTGNFMMTRTDGDDQLIPVSWVRAAQERWVTGITNDLEMVAAAVDVVGTGSTNTGDFASFVGVYDRGDYLIFGEPIKKNSSEFPSARSQSDWVVGNLRHGAPIGIDMGGGYGDVVYSDLIDLEVLCYRFLSHARSLEKTVRYGYGFDNLRTQAYIRLREALDPNQEGGSGIMLPPSKKLLSDLTTPKVTTKIIRGKQCKSLESKKEIKKRIYRSTDDGDAVAIAYWMYLKMAKDKGFKSRLKDNLRYSDADYSGQRFLGNQARKDISFSRVKRRKKLR